MLIDPRRVKAALQRYKYAVTLDLKAGYFNIPMEHHSSYLTTFITHKGKYRWLRLFFGLTQAPAFFQTVMEDVVSAGGTDHLPLMIYLDDVIIFGDDLEKLLGQAEVVMKRLAAAGFMLNLRKSHFGVK